MSKVDVIKLRKAMKKVQDSKRFEHTLGVAYTAAALAMRYDEDIRKAQIAGLLHDCAKCLKDEKILSICEKNNMSISEIERRNPFLLHAKAGAALAKDKYDVDDEDIINAINNHTTGRPGMSRLEKIIFIADYMEPGRKSAPNLSQIRKMAFEDLDETLCKILQDTLNYLKESDGEIDPATEVTCNYYCERRIEGSN